MGCNTPVKGEVDFSGKITEVEDNRILVRDEEKGLIWITLPENNDRSYETGQSVNVWTNGKINESYPMQTTAIHVEIITE